MFLSFFVFYDLSIMMHIHLHKKYIYFKTIEAKEGLRMKV